MRVACSSWGSAVLPGQAEVLRHQRPLLPAAPGRPLGPRLALLRPRLRRPQPAGVSPCHNNGNRKQVLSWFKGNAYGQKLVWNAGDYVKTKAFFLILWSNAQSKTNKHRGIRNSTVSTHTVVCDQNPQHHLPTISFSLPQDPPSTTYAATYALYLSGPSIIYLYPSHCLPFPGLSSST